MDAVDDATLLALPGGGAGFFDSSHGVRGVAFADPAVFVLRAEGQPLLSPFSQFSTAERKCLLPWTWNVAAQNFVNSSRSTFLAPRPGSLKWTVLSKIAAAVFARLLLFPAWRILSCASANSSVSRVPDPSRSKWSKSLSTKFWASGQVGKTLAFRAAAGVPVEETELRTFRTTAFAPRAEKFTGGGAFLGGAIH